MTGRIKTRIAALERKAAVVRAAVGCPACGHGGSRQPVTFNILSPGEPTGPERCAKCNRQLVFHVSFDKGG